jgi:hypothetical protein
MWWKRNNKVGVACQEVSICSFDSLLRVDGGSRRRTGWCHCDGGIRAIESLSWKNGVTGAKSYREFAGVRRCCYGGGGVGAEGLGRVLVFR